MAAKRKHSPAMQPEVAKVISSRCTYCNRGYLVVGQTKKRNITIECGYCLGTGTRAGR